MIRWLSRLFFLTFFISLAGLPSSGNAGCGDGRPLPEPVSRQVVGVGDFHQYCLKKRIENLSQLSAKMGEVRTQHEKMRYLYSTKWGWLDLSHFSFFASKANQLGDYASVYLGEFLEKNLNNVGSQWTYEDLPSNVIGAYFGTKFFDPSQPKTSAEFCKTLDSFLGQLGFVEDPLGTAPNAETVEQNLPDPNRYRGYQILYTTEGPEAYHSLDRKVADYIREVREEWILPSKRLKKIEKAPPPEPNAKKGSSPSIDSGKSKGVKSFYDVY